MTRSRPLRIALALVALATWACPVARGDAPPPPPAPVVAKPPPPPPPPPPPKAAPIPTVVHIPTDELDVLLRAQGRAILLRYDEYRELLEAARAKDAGPLALPPHDVVRLSGEGTLDLTDEHAARFAIVYRVQSLAPGPRSLGFDSGGVAIESVRVEREADAGPARYEALDGRGRLYLDGPGVRRVTVEGSAVPSVEGAVRKLDLWLPNPAAMALSVTLPPGVEARIEGEGAALVVRSPASKPVVVVTRPTRGGHLVLSWSPSAQGTEGPGVIDADVKTLFTVGDGVVAVRALVRADVLRTPVDALTLDVPADLAVHGVTGNGITGFARSDDRRRLLVRLEKPVLGRVEALVQGERPFRPGLGVELPLIHVVGALRHQGEVALRFGADVNARAVHVDGGRRVAAAGGDPATAGVLRYALFRADATVRLDVEPGALRVDATGTYYLNLAEPGQTLLATVTYRVVEGTLFRISPRFPPEFDLRELTLNGAVTGFTRDVTPDGRVEITLATGLPAGGEVLLLATLERSRADWVPEKAHVSVPFAVPSSGATREEGYAAVGADAGFEVLDAGAKDLVAVGAADLTARGLSSVGLVYGYRIDGAAPLVTLDVSRREPLVEADVVTVLHPGPRRVDLVARAVYRIQRAGVRRLFLDVPSWAGDQVDVRAPYMRAATRLTGERRPADVPAGYDRWQVDLEQRAIGTYVVTAFWFLDRGTDDWKIEADRHVAARVPLPRAERLLVVRRSQGLEVRLPALAATPDVRRLDVTELPAEAMVDPQGVLEVLRLPPARDGVEVAVTKHGGAAVLGAIATEVSIETAVAREGILRSKAVVTLFNIERQFVEVALPPSSTLVGAVVAGQPVKPLVSPTGSLLLTVPSTLPTPRVPSPRVSVALTYETRLDGPIGGDLRVEAPRFPGLEVLHTTHEVGVEPDLVIDAVGGDLASGRIARPTREPWLLALFASMDTRYALHSERGAVEIRASDVVPLNRTTGRTRTQPPGSGTDDDSGIYYGDPQADPTAGGYATPRVTRVRPGRDGAEHATPGATPSSPPEPAPGDGPATPRAPTSSPPPPGVVREPSDPGAPFPEPVPGETRNETDEDLPTEESGEAGRAGGRPRQTAGGKGRGDDFAARRGGLARKGQLSLDVPVFLAPNRVIASRIGGGGAIEVELVSKAGSERAYLLLGLLALGVGLVVVIAGWLSGLWTVLAGLVFALILHLSFGVGAATLVAAVTDAFSLLAVLLVLRWIVRRILRGRTSSMPPPYVPPAIAAVVLIAFALATASPAHADDTPAPSPAPIPAPLPDPGTVFVPQDPARGAGLAPDDRVFVPLAAWLELQRKAHPERDPELVALGQVVTLVEATYRVNVGTTDVKGTARLVYAQRGRGQLLVPVPIAGLAISEARLDGVPVRLLLDAGTYRVPLEREGDHVLELTFQAPLVVGPAARWFTFDVPTFAGAVLDVTAAAFDGDLRVSGAGRVVVLPSEGEEFAARAWLGRPTGGGATQSVTVTLAEKSPAAFRTVVKTRVESRTIHSLRDGGTETALSFDVHVLQGQASFVELTLPEGVDVLEAAGPQVQRWETGEGRLRLVLVAPTEGKISARVRAFRAAGAPERKEALPELAVRDTTGESGLVIVNGDPSLRLEAEAGSALFRTGLPAEKDAAGRDGLGRVLGAWRFAARPAPLSVRAERAQPRVEVDSRVRATFGDDRLRTVLEAHVKVQRAPVGEFVFALPGADEVRAVEGPGIETWWLDGTGDARRLLVRMRDLFEGDRALTVRLERRLGGARVELAVPRWSLVGAQADRGLLVLSALPDVEPTPGVVAGWKPLPPTRLEGQRPDLAGARATHAFEWDAPASAPLTVSLKAPEQEIEAVVVSQISPSDEEQRLEHLVLFDVRRGATDRLAVFVPDGGLAANDVVRARDLRELRFEVVTRKAADGKPVKGRLYTLSLQSAKSGLVEVTISQLWPPGELVHVVHPEGVKATRWFGLVRTFLDGEVEARVVAGAPDPADWADLPFLPTGLARTSVLRTYAARAPYLLEVVARRHRLEVQADAVVLSARAEVVLGLDGEARVRMRYRVFNRARQFLRVRLPDGAVLYGAVAAGLPVKPLAGPEGTVLLPVPKVPLGGAGYDVSITYRARAGEELRRGGGATLLLPQMIGVEIDRTAVTLRVPHGFDYEFDTKMTAATEGEALGDVVEASLREAQEVLKVAETGTLEQRQYACGNSAPLVSEARARLAEYAREGRRPERVQSLKAELEKLTQVQRDAATRCQLDARVVQSEQQFEANFLGLGGNANGQTLVDLDEVTDGLEDRAGAGQTAESAGGSANWTFNKDTVPVDRLAKKDLVELKERLQGELQRRGADERRKSVDVDKEEKSRADMSKSRAKEPAKPQEAAPDEATIRYDENRNNGLLSDRLRRVQTAHRQFGAEPGATNAPVQAPRQGAGRGSWPSGGVGGGGGGGGGFVDLTGDGSTTVLGAIDEAGGRGSTQVGLMGVDVPLPEDGRVFWFVGARAGSALTLDASPVGASWWWRTLLFLGLSAALALGIFRLVERARAQRALA